MPTSYGACDSEGCYFDFGEGKSRGMRQYVDAFPGHYPLDSGRRIRESCAESIFGGII